MRVKGQTAPSIAFLLALLAIGSAYWICSWVTAPHATVDQRILFRPEGEGDYLPQVTWLTGFDLQEKSVFEPVNTGVRAFPVIAIFLHAAMVRLLGDAGFVLADVLVVVLYGYLLSQLLRATGIPRGLAEASALFAVSGLGNLIVAQTSRFAGSFPLRFWSSRFPRPSVSELFVVLVLMVLIRLMDAGGAASRWRDWLVVGILGSCLLQADVYSAAELAIAAVPMVAYLLVRDFKRTLLGLCVAAPAAAVTAAIFLYQRTHENPDTPARWGMFTLQGHHWVMFTPLRLFAIIALVLMAGAVYWFRTPKESRTRVRATVSVMSIVLMVSAFTGPLIILLIGKGLQIYHYSVSAENLAGYAVLICGGWILRDAFGSARVWQGRGARWAATLAVFAVCLAAAAWLSYQSMEEIWWGRTQSATADPALRLAANRTAETRYRSSFEQLHDVLATPELNRAQVLGTFDGQVANWWEFRGRYLYLPDVFNTTVSDLQIEDRMYSFLHLLGATPEDFSHMLDNWYFQLRVLPESKYQANAMFTPWPLRDYTPEARIRILHTNVQSATNLELPVPEKARLMDGYTQFDPLKQHPYKLDVLVLSAGALRAYVHPENGKFRLIWKDRIFEVWIPV